MEIAILLVLIVLNGFFSMSEIALVSSKTAKLENMAADRKGGAKTDKKDGSNQKPKTKKKIVWQKPWKIENVDSAQVDVPDEDVEETSEEK